MPNAFSPALPCTLLLEAPGNRLTARGLHMFSQPTIVPQESGEFGYLPFGSDDLSFDHVNVFWHAQQHLLRLERYGIDLEEFPVLLHVQPGAGSFTHFLEPISTIGTGLNGLDRGAKDSDIIVHEITHAVFNPRMPLGGYPIDKGEAIPVLEGLADYFAAAVNGDTRIGEFARPPAGYHNIATDPAVYHYSRFDVLPGDPYSRGKVLNGALLEIRESLGETADELVVGALDYAPLRCFTCFADAVRWADGERYAGAHLGTINAAFERRGIGTGPPLVRDLVVPAWGWNDEDVTAKLLHSCGVGPFQITWSLRDSLGNVQVLPFQGDEAVFRAPGGVWIQATLRDALGVDHSAQPKHVGFFNRNDPQNNLGRIAIRGPSPLFEFSPASFTFELPDGAGVPPVTQRWTVWNASVRDGLDGRVVNVVPLTNPMRLKVTYRDAMNRVAEDSISVPVQTALRSGPVTGPAAMELDRVGTYSVLATAGSPPYRYAWTQTMGGEQRALPDTSHVTSWPATGDFTMRVTVSDSRGAIVTVSMPVRVVAPLEVGPIEGPATVISGNPGQFRVTLRGGASPFQFLWIQQHQFSSFTLANAYSVYTRPVNEDFTLRVTVLDATGASGSQSRAIQVANQLVLGQIEGPATVYAGRGEVFRVRPQGGVPPYRYYWSQHDELSSFPLPDSNEVTTRPATRDHWLTVSVGDALGQFRAASKRVVVQPAPPEVPESRTFRLLGNVLHRGAVAVFQLPTPDAPGDLEVLDAAGRLRASGRIPAGSPPTLNVPLPQDLDSGIYFVRLRRTDRTWTSRLVVIAK